MKKLVIINDKDKVSETYYVPYVDVNADLIINELDKVIVNKEGEMGYKVKDNLNLSVFIGSEKLLIVRVSSVSQKLKMKSKQYCPAKIIKVQGGK